MITIKDWLQVKLAEAKAKKKSLKPWILPTIAGALVGYGVQKTVNKLTNNVERHVNLERKSKGLPQVEIRRLPRGKTMLIGAGLGAGIKAALPKLNLIKEKK